MNGECDNNIIRNIQSLFQIYKKLSFATSDKCLRYCTWNFFFEQLKSQSCLVGWAGWDNRDLICPGSLTSMGLKVPIGSVIQIALEVLQFYKYGAVSYPHMWALGPFGSFSTKKSYCHIGTFLKFQKKNYFIFWKKNVLTPKRKKTKSKNSYSNTYLCHESWCKRIQGGKRKNNNNNVINVRHANPIPSRALREDAFLFEP